MRLNDWAVEARDRLLQADIKNPEKLTRPELKAKREEARPARPAERSSSGLTKFEATYPAALKPWAKLERLTLQAKHDADPNAVAADLFTLLGDAPLAVPGEDDEVTVDRALSLALQGPRRGPRPCTPRPARRPRPRPSSACASSSTPASRPSPRPTAGSGPCTTCSSPSTARRTSKPR